MAGPNFDSLGSIQQAQQILSFGDLRYSADNLGGSSELSPAKRRKLTESDSDRTAKEASTQGFVAYIREDIVENLKGLVRQIEALQPGGLMQLFGIENRKVESCFEALVITAWEAKLDPTLSVRITGIVERIIGDHTTKVRVRVGDHIYQVSKLLLASLKEGWVEKIRQENELVELADVDSTILEAIIHFYENGLHTKALEDLDLDVLQLLSIAAQEMQLVALMESCEAIFQKRINPSNVLDVMSSAISLNSPEIVLRCQGIINQANWGIQLKRVQPRNRYHVMITGCASKQFVKPISPEGLKTLTVLRGNIEKVSLGGWIPALRERSHHLVWDDLFAMNESLSQLPQSIYRELKVDPTCIDDLSFALHVAPSLTVLRISNENQTVLPDETNRKFWRDLSEVAKHTKCLQYLILDKTLSVDPHFFEKLLGHSGTITHLIMGFAVSEKLFSTIIKSSTTLTYLRLKDAREVGDDVLTDVVKRCQKLEKLKMAECQKLTNNGLSAIANYAKNLQEIELQNCLALTDNSVRDFLKAFSRLRKVRFIQCQKITNMTIKYINEHGKAIQYVDIRECGKISTADFKGLRVGITVCQDEET